MMLSVTKVIGNIGRTKFHKMMLAGAFPKVNYHQNSGERGVKWETYNMVEYSTAWATFMKVADMRIKEKTGDNLGVFTRKHSAQFLARIREIVDNITEADVYVQSDRFQTMWD